jgi:hypothetical protein
VEIKNPGGEITKGSVATVGGALVITTPDGIYKAQELMTNTGKETSTIALAMSGSGGRLPDSLASAMDGTDGDKVYILSKCNTHGTSAGCDFKPALPSAAQVRHEQEMFARRLFAATAPVDLCNQYKTCSACVAAHDTHQCGWCVGAFINYNDTTMPTNEHCGGDNKFVPFAFTCPTEYRTASCDGYNCNYNTYKCDKVADHPMYPTLDICLNGTQSQPACKKPELQRCNHTDSKCYDCAPGDDTDCVPKENCGIACAIKHAKCNHTTHQCHPCNPTTDPGCSLSADGCKGECSKTYSKCDRAAGACTSCEPSVSDPECKQNGCDAATCKGTSTSHLRLRVSALLCALGLGPVDRHHISQTLLALDIGLTVFAWWCNREPDQVLVRQVSPGPVCLREECLR